MYVRDGVSPQSDNALAETFVPYPDRAPYGFLLALRVHHTLKKRCERAQSR
jgi:hypothetical protein